MVDIRNLGFKNFKNVRISELDIRTLGFGNIRILQHYNVSWNIKYIVALEHKNIRTSFEDANFGV